MNRKVRSLITLAAVASASPAFAEPGGCLKYGAAGAVAGHYAKHHGVMGAMGGCVVGMYQRHKYRKNLRDKAAAWDKEHANDSKENSKATLAQKGQWYDAEQAASDKAQASTPASAQ